MLTKENLKPDNPQRQLTCPVLCAGPTAKLGRNSSCRQLQLPAHRPILIYYYTSPIHNNYFQLALQMMSSIGPD